MAANVEVVRVGSRTSQLAMIQTHSVVNQLQSLHPSVHFRIVTMKTIGDKVLDKPLSNIGQTNLFTKELEIALEAGEVDLIVHSLKDLPTTLPEGMQLGAVCEREDPTDCLILSPANQGLTLDTLPAGSTIGTSSLRRVAQLKRCHPSFNYVDIRGNLNTRLAKLDSDSKEYDGIVLASAGVKRMGWHDRISEIIDYSKCLYAVGQGALAVEVRQYDARIIDIVKPLNHLVTVLCCSAEREFLKVLGGGCSVPVGVHTCVNEGKLSMDGAVYSLDGSEALKESVIMTAPQDTLASFDLCEKLGKDVGSKLANDLLSRGAGNILARAKDETEQRTLKLQQNQPCI
jgi:hydroxymethylbilane synthase